MSEIITYLSNMLPNIIDTVSGALITCIFLRGNTSTKEFEKIKSGVFKEVVDDLLKSGNMTYTEFYKTKNFLKIAEKADEYYSKMPTNNETFTYNFDWFFRFYEAVGTVGDETMQNLWAKILAGEVNQPSSYSLQTIETLRNMTKEDAKLFANICSHSFIYTNMIFLPHNDVYLKKCGIYYGDIVRLDEMGLIHCNNLNYLNFYISAKPKAQIKNNQLLMLVTSTGVNKTCQCYAYVFTKTGRELYSLTDNNATDDDFIEFGKCFNKIDNSYTVAIYKIRDTDGGIKCDESKNLIDD